MEEGFEVKFFDEGKGVLSYNKVFLEREFFFRFGRRLRRVRHWIYYLSIINNFYYFLQIKLSHSILIKLAIKSTQQTYQLLMFLPNLLYPAAALPKASLSPLFLPLFLQMKKMIMQGRILRNIPPTMRMKDAVFLFSSEVLVFSKMCFVSLKWALKYLPSSNSSFSLYP